MVRDIREGVRKAFILMAVNNGHAMSSLDKGLEQMSLDEAELRIHCGELKFPELDLDLSFDTFDPEDHDVINDLPVGWTRECLLREEYYKAEATGEIS